ncbi:MAG: enoyl-CoA hydratase/isomerase family protein [Saprospiraceae bacterium]|nr:enoyl-CoA hydratase/isomerase family protein [Saprospiraceae bacterium]
MKQYVQSINVGALSVVEFYTEKSNSLPSEILDGIAASINEADKDPSTRIILLRSGGEKAFCAGASFEELSSIHNEEEGLKFFSGFAKVILAIRSIRKIVIGRIHGKAVGGGVGIAAACDIALASQYATLRLSELAVGIGPFVIGPAVERKMGLSAFSLLALTPEEWRTAYWAKEKGLYHEVFETHKKLDEYIDLLKNSLLSYNDQALIDLKKVFWQNTEHWPDLLIERAKISGRLVLSDFTKNKLQSFKA